MLNLDFDFDADLDLFDTPTDEAQPLTDDEILALYFGGEDAA